MLNLHASIAQALTQLMTCLGMWQKYKWGSVKQPAVQKKGKYVTMFVSNDGEMKP